MQRFDPRIRLPQFLTRYFPGAIWRAPANGNQVFLTFDDGPVPEVTPWVLDLLKKEQINACFFCVGENVMKYPEIYRRILEERHRVGNHTFNHLQGLKTPDADYFSNVEKAAGYIESPFFRPPHGWMRRSQFRQLRKQYQVVMWDLISRDYRNDVGPETIVRNVMDFVRPGSVIIFHDSYKAKTNLYKALPEVIRQLKMKGYQFGDLAQVDTKNNC